MKTREIIRLLHQNGFIEESENDSSHLKLHNPFTNTTVMVPRHAQKLGKGSERAILKEAGLKKEKNHEER